jgi:hypothetical protein
MVKRSSYVVNPRILVQGYRLQMGLEPVVQANFKEVLIDYVKGGASTT